MFCASGMALSTPSSTMAPLNEDRRPTRQVTGKIHGKSRCAREVVHRPPIAMSSTPATTQAEANDALIYLLPEAELQREKLGDDISYRHAVHDITRIDHTVPVEELAFEGHALVALRLATQVGSATKKGAARGLRTKSTAALSHAFQTLVAISYCIYLDRKGSDVVDKILQALTGFDEYKRRRLLKRAKFINQIINRIAKLQDWDVCRSTELFYLCKSQSAGQERF